MSRANDAEGSEPVTEPVIEYVAEKPEGTEADVVTTTQQTKVDTDGISSSMNKAVNHNERFRSRHRWSDRDPCDDSSLPHHLFMRMKEELEVYWKGMAVTFVTTASPSLTSRLLTAHWSSSAKQNR